jgi:glutamyl-tRNA synthetase
VRTVHNGGVHGRFAPSPTGSLHVGNLRTALLAWVSSSRTTVRMEDLDPITSSTAHEARQLADLAAIGLVPDGPVVRQSDRFDLHRAAIARLDELGLVYPCYCSRREIREAAAAPHGELPDGAYPGTCRALSGADRTRREREGRRPALRLRTDGEVYEVDDRIAGRFRGAVDDVVLQRNDGVPAYNLAVVVDDHLQGIELVVRGDDLLTSTPRQMHLHALLGQQLPTYAHVPLVVGPDGERLAKRHGAVTLADWIDGGGRVDTLVEYLAASLGLSARVDGEPLGACVELWRGEFSFTDVPRSPWVFDASATMHP